MDPIYIIRQLEQNKVVIQSLLTSDKPGAHLWKASPDTWCLLEVACHLVDEETDDFRIRVKTALEPEKYPFLPIDPVGWVNSRKYLQQDFESKITQWIKEREKSLTWLRSLDNPDWNSHFIHDQLGPMSAAKLLSNWLAHDYMHIRQVLRIKHAYLAQSSGQDLSYAGPW